MRRFAIRGRTPVLGPRLSGLRRTLAAALAPAAAALGLWLRRRRTRRHMARLSDFMLNDIGVSRAEVEAEAHKPFWRA